MNDRKILVLDDDPVIRDLLYEILTDDYNTITSEDGYEALEILNQNEIALALVDINMPRMNGIDFIHRAKKRHPGIGYLIISGNDDINNAIDALQIGVCDFIRKPFKDILYIKNIIKGALSRHDLLLENKRYKENLEKMVMERTRELELKNSELQYSRSRLIGVLSRAAEYKDFETGQHFIRVSVYSSLIAKSLGLSKEQIEIIKEAAPVHDIGKIGIPENILLKKGKLTDEEFSEMKNHCLYGEEILTSPSFDILMHKNPYTIDENLCISDNLLKTAALIAKSHHERFDGSGYPQGLRGGEIPLEAKIVAVADVYDAIGTERPYKKAWKEEACQEYIYSQSGTLFDPNIVDAFFQSIDEILNIKKSFIDDYAVVKSYLA